MRGRETKSKGKRIRAGTKADVSNVVATVAGDCTNDVPAQRAAASATSVTPAAAAAASATADAAGMLMLCLLLCRRLFQAEPDNLRHRLRCRPLPPVPAALPRTPPGYIINYGTRDVRMRRPPASLSNRFPEATAATRQFARYRLSSSG